MSEEEIETWFESANCTVTIRFLPLELVWQSIVCGPGGHEQTAVGCAITRDKAIIEAIERYNRYFACGAV